MNHFAKPSGRATDAALLDSMRDDASSQPSSTEVIRIHKDFLRPDKNQPRKHIPPEVLRRRRAQLEEDGQEELITVWPGVREDDGNTYFDILDGECRWRSILPSEKVDYLEAKIERRLKRDDRAGTLISQLLHNNDGAADLTQLEQAYAYRKIVEHLESQGVDSPKSVAAKRLGFESVSVFSELLSLADLPEELGEFALEKGVSDTRVLNGMVQVYRRGGPEDVELMRERITSTLEEGGKLRPAMKEMVDKVKSRKRKKPAATKSKGKNEKPSRLLTARDVKVSLKDDGTGVMTLETPREVIRFNISKEQLDSLQRQD